jgi:hypothetical protein
MMKYQKKSKKQMPSNKSSLCDTKTPYRKTRIKKGKMHVAKTRKWSDSTNIKLKEFELYQIKKIKE